MSLDVFCAFFEIMTLSLMFILQLLLFYRQNDLQKQINTIREDLNL